MLNLFRKIFGTANERYLKSLAPLVEAINHREADIRNYDDATLKDQTRLFRQRLSQGETLDDLLIDAFAVVRETAKRVLGQRPFDVQLIGGIILHRGMITEMKTGEGKTLAATLPVYLNALSGKGVHVVTVNDYLAQRDSEWMGEIYRFLGLSVGCILHDIDEAQRIAAYQADITYGTNNEFGFDYLRDNMKFSIEHMCQRPFSYAILDEVDSILIDEARTPLIISGPSEGSSQLYARIDSLIPKLQAQHFEKDEKTRTIALTEAGIEKIEALLSHGDLLKKGSLYDVENSALVHHVTQALRAHQLFARDVDYIVRDDQVILVDEFTGRMMEGRRFSEGLHQALEAKEKAHIQLENQTFASITYQNYFRLYPKLAGMTGTALTEAGEFSDIYRLEVMSIPTHLDCIRKDHDDRIYKTLEEKHRATIALIAECHQRRQPVLVGTVSIEKSEELSLRLKKQHIPHKVLNARYHEKEAAIIAQAGRAGAVTIATNMAGRGTDIQLGGTTDIHLTDATQQQIDEAQRYCEEEKKIAIAAGGLFVIVSERHESRRIDNQLRGRSGRQGDPGASQFFLSLEDDLMRIFGSERLEGMLTKLGIGDDEAIIHPWINKAIEKAQKKVEDRNFEIRKNLLRFDDVMNDQRKEIYRQRREIIEAETVHDMIEDMRAHVLNDIRDRFLPKNSLPEQWNIQGLHADCLRIFGLELPLSQWRDDKETNADTLMQRIEEHVHEHMEEKSRTHGQSTMQMVEKNVLLRVLDQVWKDHLLELDHLRQGINLRAYAQRDPLNEYKQEAFLIFSEMLEQLREKTTAILAHLRLYADREKEAIAPLPVHRDMQAQQPSIDPPTAGPLMTETPNPDKRASTPPMSDPPMNRTMRRTQKAQERRKKRRGKR